MELVMISKSSVETKHMEVHVNPMGNHRESSVAQDIVGKSKLAEGKEDETAPLGEGWRGEVEYGGH